MGRNNSIIQKPLNNPIHDYKTSTECQIYTLERFPEGVIVNLGGIVSAKSVKLIQTDESDVRDNWWSELRDEVKFLQCRRIEIKLGQIARKDTGLQCCRWVH